MLNTIHCAQDKLYCARALQTKFKKYVHEKMFPLVIQRLDSFLEVIC